MGRHGLHSLAFAGSLRQGSYTRAPVETLDDLGPEDVAVEVAAGLKTILICNQNSYEAVLPKSVTHVAADGAGADAALLVSREYNHRFIGI